MDFDGLNDYRQDSDLEAKAGIDLAFTDGVTITILRAGGSNFRYVEAYQEATEPYRTKRGMRKIPLDEDRDILRQVYARAVVIGWSGVKSNGQEVPFTEETVLAFLRRFDSIFDEIIYRATEASNFLEEQKQKDGEVLGNS